jgi:hypothetical protein
MVYYYEDMTALGVIGKEKDCVFVSKQLLKVVQRNLDRLMMKGQQGSQACANFLFRNSKLAQSLVIGLSVVKQ